MKNIVIYVVYFTNSIINILLVLFKLLTNQIYLIKYNNPTVIIQYSHSNITLYSVIYMVSRWFLDGASMKARCKLDHASIKSRLPNFAV